MIVEINNAHTDSINVTFKMQYGINIGVLFRLKKFIFLQVWRLHNIIVI